MKMSCVIISRGAYHMNSQKLIDKIEHELALC